jgi:hypothetical protein
MKDVATSDAKVVSITFTPQGHTYIYELLVHESIVNNLPCTYFLTIGVFPSCICPDFISNVANSKNSYFLSCKHMYFINNLCLNLIRDIRTHQLLLNWNNVKDIMKQDPFEFSCATWLHIGNMVSNSGFGIFQCQPNVHVFLGFDWFFYNPIHE